MAKGLKIEFPENTEAARRFFDWNLTRHPIFDGGGNEIKGFTQFMRGGRTLHVGNSTYTPAQPIDAFNAATDALDESVLAYSVNRVGEYDNGAQIFAQFDVSGKSEFDVKGKKYKGLLTMGKGSDQSMPLMFWLTVICIICANTFRAAIRVGRSAAKSGDAVSVRQTKNSANRVAGIKDEIAELFGLRETVEATLKRMAESPLSVDDGRKAFVALIKGEEPGKITQRGETRLNNRVDAYMAAFQSSPGVNGGQTREDWFNAVSFVDTHGNQDSDNFNAEKNYLSSEFGAQAARKEKAFALAGSDKFEKLIVTGDEILQSLLAKTVAVPVIGATTKEAKEASDFQRLLGKY